MPVELESALKQGKLNLEKIKTSKDCTEKKEFLNSNLVQTLFNGILV
jgi:hypothetical protein